MTSADSDSDIDAARGFDEDELATCVRVLTLLGGGASARGEPRPSISAQLPVALPPPLLLLLLLPLMLL